MFTVNDVLSVYVRSLPVDFVLSSQWITGNLFSSSQISGNFIVLSNYCLLFSQRYVADYKNKNETIISRVD
jgi:hypothetical protein